MTEVLVDKDEAVKALYTEDAALHFLNERYNPTGLYDFTFNERSGNYVFTLKRDIMRREWIPALKTFYSIRYPDWKDETNVIRELERLNDPDQWLGKEMIYGHQNYSTLCSTTTSPVTISVVASWLVSILSASVLTGRSSWSATTT